MREIVAPVDLCTAQGRLASTALGWSRRPLHRSNLRGFLSKKRWDYWVVTDERVVMALLIADLDYVSCGAVLMLDVETGQRLDRVVPWVGGIRMPDTVGGAAITFEHLGTKIVIAPGRLQVAAAGVRADIEVAAPDESVNLVVPWDDRRFHFTSKQIGLPARGRIEWGDRIINIADGWAGLDFGRGTMPRRIRWNWAAAAGRGVSFNLGGRWTDDTGITENGLVVDGKLRKIHEPVRFEPDGRIVSDEVDLRFRPLRERRVGLPGRAGLLWHAGRFSGRILDRTIDDLFGWSEAFDMSW